MEQLASKHEQVKQHLKKEITEGNYESGEKLPSEKRLCDYFKVSRVTVRHALQNLENDGLIYRKQGVGAFVSDKSMKSNLVRLTDFAEDMRLAGSDYAHRLLKEGDEFAIGNIRFTVKHTPGHTPEHLSYLVTDGAAANEPMGILSGDFVFVGDVGRPDLLETAAGMEGVMEDSAREMYRSLQTFMDMPEYWQVWPGHGAGSACGKALGAIPESTVGYEQRFNDSLNAATSEQNFVDYILQGQPEPPLYFARMKRDNRKGPKVLGDLPKPHNMTVAQMIGEVRMTQAVILDTRERTEYMNGHIQGSLLSPLNKAFNTVAGSYILENEKIFLIIEEEKVEEAVTDLIRIGLDDVVGYATPEQLNKFEKDGGELFSTETINFEAAEDHLKNENAYLLDVRTSSEFEEGHISGALNISHTRLLDRMEEVPEDKPVMVSCQSGARAAAASALLESKDFVVKYVDDMIEEWLEGNK